MLDPIVDLSPGAEENELAAFFADSLRQNLRTNRRAQKSFGAMRATVHFVAVDTTESVTMRFDHGRVTVHEGTIGIPAVTFCGDRALVAGLTGVPLSSLLGLPLPAPSSPRDWAALRTLARGLSDRRLIVYGFFSHPRLVTRILRVLSSRD
ncbi:MAG: hypothetical protein R3B70_20720 [Polyangiaceae bacterium]